MAKAPLRPCKHAGCPELTRDGWCDKHRPATAARRISSAWHDWYKLPIWTRRLRPAQLAREPFCRACTAEGRDVRATVVDHITPFRGDWYLFVSPANLQSLCKHHHDAKTAREQAEARRNGQAL